MHNSLKTHQRGFTIVELLIVIVVIGILAAISIVSYNGIQQNARDKGVLSDTEAVSSYVARYSTKNNGQLGSGIVWYSGGLTNTNIEFIPSSGNIIDVAANNTQYCIRGYNSASASYKTLSSAATIGSDNTACLYLDPSASAYAADPDEAGFNVLTWTQQTGSGSRNWKSVASSSDGVKIVAVVTGGFIYTSADSGVTWIQRTASGSRSWTGVTSSNDGTKLAATSYGFIYTSADSGVTWTQRATSQNWESIAASSDGSKLAAGTNSIYTSADSGVTWSATSAPFASSSWIGIGSSSDGTKLVAGNNGESIYTSSNSGSTWTIQASAGVSGWGNVISSSNGAKTATYRQNGVVVLSSDGGTTWANSTTGSGYCNGVTSSANGRKLWASGPGTTTYRSTNAGVNWVSSTMPANGCWVSFSASDDGRKVVSVMINGFIATGVYSP